MLQVGNCFNISDAMLSESVTMLCTALCEAMLSCLEAHAGSQSGMVHTSSLRVALSGLGLTEQQVGRIVVKLVVQLQQHTTQQQPVTLQVKFMFDSSLEFDCVLSTAS